MHYTAHVDLAFWSIKHIMRDINNGWLFCYLQSKGAFRIFIMLYVYVDKALYYIAYILGQSRAALLLSVIIIFLLMIGTVTIGYALP